MTPAAYATAKQVAVSSIPVIDIAPLESGAHADLASVGAQMRAAVEDIGFFYVKNHSVDLMLIEQVNSLAHQFFAQPLASKLQVEPTDRHRGYLKIGEAKMYARAKVLSGAWMWQTAMPTTWQATP